MSKIKLGDVAKDKITGFEGAVVAISYWLNSCERITLQPPSLDKDGVPLKDSTFDSPQLELVSGKNLDLAFKPDVSLGDKVRDTVTGFEGVVIALSHWMSGEIRVSVQPRELKEDGTLQSSKIFAQGFLEISNKGEVEAPVFKKKEKTGGPAFEPLR